jgi:hypothetical protein
MKTTTPPRLNPELRSLCARLACERLRPATWDAARDLRQQVLQRLVRGETAEALAAELHTAIQVCADGARARRAGPEL